MKLNLSVIVFSCIIVSNSIFPASSTALGEWKSEERIYKEFLYSMRQNEVFKQEQRGVIGRLPQAKENLDLIKQHLHKPEIESLNSSVQKALAEVERFDTLINKYALLQDDLPEHKQHILGKFNFIWDYLDYFHALSHVSVRGHEQRAREQDMLCEQEQYALDLTRYHVCKGRTFIGYRTKTWNLQNQGHGYFSWGNLKLEVDMPVNYSRASLHTLLFHVMRQAFGSKNTSV